MTLIQKFKENRLKFASMIAVTGDFMMGMAGGVSIFTYRGWTGWDDFLLVAAGCTFISAHAGLLLWGKGGRMDERCA
jgi:hypothetical protein